MKINITAKDGKQFTVDVAENTVKEFVRKTAGIGRVIFLDENTYLSMDYIGYMEKAE